MTPIEAAAREIAAAQRAKSGRPLGEKSIIEIIARHLFPVVKPEDCDRKRLYYYKSSNGTWIIDDGTWAKLLEWAKLLDDIVEIRGPIPMPEVRS